MPVAASAPRLGRRGPIALGLLSGAFAQAAFRAHHFLCPLAERLMPVPTPQPNQPAAATPQPRADASQTAGGTGGGQPGLLRNPLFVGNQTLQRVAAGQTVLRAGSNGPAVLALQQFLVGRGLAVGRAGPDGAWGPATTAAVRAFQAQQGLTADAVVGKDTLRAMDRAPASAAPVAPGAVSPGSPGQSTTAPLPSAAPQPGSGPSAGNTQPRGAQRAQDGAPGSRNGGLPADFQQMWDAHPHNYLSDPEQNTASSDLLVAQGWSPDQYSNTCAIRLSIMFNQLGGNYVLTRDKAKAAGIAPGRVPYSKKTGWYYILSAKEMWQYVEAHFGQAHAEFPASGRFASPEAYKKAFSDEIGPLVAGRRGIVAFDKIFTYAGTGHVDIFSGMQLSDAPSWYPCQAIKLWFV